MRYSARWGNQGQTFVGSEQIGDTQAFLRSSSCTDDKQRITIRRSSNDTCINSIVLQDDCSVDEDDAGVIEFQEGNFCHLLKNSDNNSSSSGTLQRSRFGSSTTKIGSIFTREKSDESLCHIKASK